MRNYVFLCAESLDYLGGAKKSFVGNKMVEIFEQKLRRLKSKVTIRFTATDRVT